MSPYREGPPAPRPAPRARWWRLAGAWLRGSLRAWRLRSEGRCVGCRRLAPGLPSIRAQVSGRCRCRCGKLASALRSLQAEAEFWAEFWGGPEGRP